MNGRKLMKSSKRILAVVLATVMMITLLPQQEITTVADDNSPYVISLGRATYSSSANGNATSDNAVDGDTSTRWESAWDNETEWFYVDLGKSANITSIYISWEGAYATQYNIQTSNDEENWNTVYQNLTCTGGKETITLSATARYVRINLTKKALSAYGYSFYAFQVMGTGGLTPRPADYGENLALNKDVAYSAIRDEWWMYDDQGNLKEDALVSVQGSNAVDGNDNTSFTSYQSNNQWFYVDLGQAYEIGRIILKWNSDAGKIYDIDVSSDGENWTTVFRKLDGHPNHKVNIPVYVGSARYVRVHGYARVENGSGFGICELEVYEYISGEEKVTYTISELPETEIVYMANGSYVTNDMYLTTAKLPIYIDKDNVKFPIASNDWWQSSLLKQFGNNMCSLPFKAGYSKKGLSVITATDGWLPTPGPTDVNISVWTESVPDFYILPENMDTLSAYDRVHDNSDYSVDMQLCDDSGVLMTSTHTKGSPYIFCEFETDAFYLSVPNLTSFFDDAGNSILADGQKITTDHIGIHVTDDDNEAKTKTSNSYYCLSFPAGTTIKNNGGTLKITFPANGKYLSIGTMLNKSDLNTFYQHGYAFVTSAYVTYSYNEAMSQITSNYVVTTELKRNGFSNVTMQLMLPHQWKYANEESQTVMTYPSVRGDMHGIWSNSFTTVDTFAGLLPNFAMPDNPEFDQAKVVAYLGQLWAYTKNAGGSADAYWEGKTVHPLAMGVMMADQLGEIEMRNNYLGKLKERLLDWFTYEGTDDDCYFIYDKNWGTIYYQASEFGANTGIADHHFTYGYFLFGATVLSMYDDEFYNDYKDIIEMMIRDYANPSHDDPEYCRFRAYDMYEGHSWAGGYADNDNGNNQESASESLFSWASMYLWGVLTENDVYRDAAVFGFTNEMEAILQYWFDYDKQNWVEDWPYDCVAQVYGGGNFFGTFFGGYPVYCYGIQWLPISEYLTYYGIDNDRCAEIYAALERDSAEAREKAYLVNINNGMSEEEAMVEYEKYPYEDNGWMHITWPFLSQTDPVRALAKLEAYGNVGDADQATTYWFMNSMLDFGHKTDEVVATGDIACSVYYNEDTGAYTANAWNPCNEAKEVAFLQVATGKVLGSATIGAKAMVQFEVPTDENFEYIQAETPVFNATALSDGKVETGLSGNVTFDDTQLVEISTSTDGAIIYYTTDGSIPTTESDVYTDKFLVSSDATIKAIAVKEGYITSAFAALSIKINGDSIESENNLALGCNVTVSSVEGAHNGVNMTDGDSSSRWSSAAGNDDEYAIVDLGAACVINTIVIDWEAAYAKQYDLLVSLDGDTWTTIANIKGGSAGESKTVFDAVKARYVKVQGVERGTAYGYSIFELEVYGAVQASAPIITPVGGTFNGPQTVTLSTEVKGAEIKYTTDGTTPTVDSPSYIQPFTVDKSTVVKAITYRKGMSLSEVTTSTIIISGTIAISDAEMVVAVGNSKKLTAVADTAVTWTSRDDNIATVDANGNVTGVSIGQTVITVSNGTYSADCIVTVKQAVPLQSINLSATELTVKVKYEGTLSYTLNPEDTTDDISNIVWVSSDNSVVEVNNGAIVAKREGTATVTVSCGNVSASCVITVEPKYTTAEKLVNSEYNVMLDGTTLYQSGCFEGGLDNLTDLTGFGANAGGNWASQSVGSDSGDTFLIFSLADSYAINQIEALYVSWKNNDMTLPTDGFKIMVADDSEFDITTATGKVQSSNADTTIVTEDNSAWTVVFDSSYQDALNAAGGYDWAQSEAGCLSIIPFFKTYGKKFNHVKIAFNYNGASKPWGIQAYEIGLLINDEEPVLGEIVEPEIPTTEAPTEAPTEPDDGIERPVEPFGIVCTDTGEGGFVVVMGNPGNGQTYNIYVDGVLIKNVSLGAHTITGIPAGTHTVSITGVLNGYESTASVHTVEVTGESVTEAPTEAPKVDPQVDVDGFQISTTLGGARTVYTIKQPENCKEIAEVGLVYGLASEITKNDMMVGANSEYVKAFAATSAGIISQVGEDTTYVMTMTMNIGKISVAGINAIYYVRAYTKLSDGTYVYSDVEEYSLYSVATYLYENDKMPTKEKHDYLYDYIISPANKAYTKIEFNPESSIA